VYEFAVAGNGVGVSVVHGWPTPVVRRSIMPVAPDGGVHVKDTLAGVDFET
jgi:hypothetical protein